MAAAHRDLRSFLRRLQGDGDLVVIDAPVDARLEVAEIHRRVIAAGGPALLFTNVRGAGFPLVTNLFGTPTRAAQAFGDRPQAFIEGLVGLVRNMPPTPASLWQARGLAAAAAHIGLRRVSRGPVSDVMTSDVRLDRLPALTVWPEDGGPFVTLPLVMPPVATGLILLMLLAPRGALGGVLGGLGIEIVFTWKAVVIAMAVMGLPLMVRTARAGFEQVDRRYEQVASTLGANPFRVFVTVTLPLALPSVLAAAVLCFARAIGEFGATMMIAGSIPGSTRTLAVAIYSFAETGRDTEASQLVLVSACIAFVALVVSNWITTRSGIRA